MFLFPKNKKPIKKNKKLYITILVTSLIAIVLCCYYLFSLYLLPSASTSDSMEGINMIGQLKYIITNPVYAVKTMYTLFNQSFSGYVDMFFGMRLGWLDIYNVPFIIWIYEFLFFSSPFIEGKEENTLIRSEKIFCNLLVIFVSFLAVLSMWICWTPIGEVVIAGIQGRYFLPVILLTMLTLVNSSQKVKVNNYHLKLSCVMIFVHFAILLKVIGHFM